jgi:Amt family ammonium transporter
VVITPAAGVVQPYGAIILGAASSLACYGAILMKYKLGYDDTLDVFGVHGVGSGLGVLLLSFFIRPSWLAEAAQKAGGAWGALNQLSIQAAGMSITIVYAGILTLVLVWLINQVMGFRLDEQDEVVGLDQSLHGEHGYGLLDVR